MFQPLSPRVSLYFLSLLALALPGGAASLAVDVETPFERPPHVAKAVDFWSRVYSEIDTQSGFIHDRRFPEVVYEWLPLDAGDTPRRQQRDIDARVADYRGLLNDMAQRDRRDFSAEQRRILALWRDQTDQSWTPADWRRAAERIRFQRGQADRFRKGMQRQDKYGPTVHRILDQHGLPQELAAIPHVESSYNPRVKSHAGALGLWQIMPATGRRYLRITGSVDERLDVEKATHAAARLLKHNYSVLQSWPLAVTAYNRGLAGVRRAVHGSGTRDIGVITRDYEGRAFGFASRNFYAAFLAAHDVSTGRFGAEPARWQSGQQLVLERFLPASAVVQEFGLDSLVLKQANPTLGMRYWNGEKLLSAQYRLNLPVATRVEDLEPALRSLEALYGVDSQHPDRFYRIQRGDKLTLLARDLNTDVSGLMRLNGVRSVHRIYAGQILRLPSGQFDIPAQRQTARVAYASIPLTKVRREARSTAVRRGQMVYGVLRDELAERAVSRYAYEAMRLSSPSAWDTRVAAAIPAMRVPAVLQSAAALEQTLLAGGGSAGASDLQADPADYLVADDGTIEIQVGETLGHYAHWLELRSKDLRRANRLGRYQPVVVGRRVQLDFSLVNRARFEQRRRAYHERLQARYFSRYRIAGVQEHALNEGDNLWELANDEYAIPLWLLRQYNPDVDFSSVLALNERLTIPLVTLKS